MAEIKGHDGDIHRLHIAETTENTAKKKKNKKIRVASVDVFRGLTVALMILVDDAGGEWPVIGHAPWNGCNLADFVMRFFLFIVDICDAFRVNTVNSKLTEIVQSSVELSYKGCN